MRPFFVRHFASLKNVQKRSIYSIESGTYSSFLTELKFSL